MRFRDATTGMDHTHIVPFWRRMVAVTTSPGIVLLSMLTLQASLAAQCPNQGSVPVAASWQASPLALGCAADPGWPQWHLYTPAHRAPAPHMGFRPGDVTSRPRLLVAWRCTGYLFVPVVPWRITTMGFVLDRPETPC